MHDSNPPATFGYVARELGRRKLGFLFAREYFGPDRLGPQLKKQFGGVFIANEKYTLAQANQVIADGEADAVAFGQLFIANPDLPARFTSNAPLNAPDGSTFFRSGPQGYTDYPALSCSKNSMQSKIFAAKMLPNLQPAGHGLIVWDQPKFSLPKSAPIPDLNSEDLYFRVALERSKPIRKMASS